VPALLEVFDVPHSGAAPACLGLCYDKALVRAIAESLAVPVPLESYCGPDDTSATLPSSFPALVKPNLGDSSLGITKDAVVSDSRELMSYMTWLRQTLSPRGILVQEFLCGPEYSVAIIGNPGLSSQILPILEVDYSGLDPHLPRILSYESKWHPESPYWNEISYREAKLDLEAIRKLSDYASVLFERLGCRDYARFDFRCDAQGTIKLLEVNPNPGWCWDGKLNLMAGFGGLRYSELLRMILEAAQERCLAGAGSRVLVAATA
jgi:D-alanine-D-alanine ligase